MDRSFNLDTFLLRNRIDSQTWERCALEVGVLQEIAEDHMSQNERLRDAAELFARVIQRFPTVHSVRWRVKETEHLLEKIVRKRADGQEKYKSISAGNYFEIVTDLVGLRALHLFKDDCFEIDTHLRRTWKPTEAPTAYIRDGDPQDLTARFSDCGFEVKSHPAGYRSIHYVCSTQPLQRTVYAEIQVRTIFEEGWSEIDHRVRYPNYSNDQLVAYFLTIFNRLAGSADEMGTFVQGLTSALGAFDLKLQDANRQKEEALSAMDSMLTDLNAMRKQDESTNKKIASLQHEIAKLRGLPSLNEIFGDTNRNALASLAGLDSKNLLLDMGKSPSLAESLRLMSSTSGTEAFRKAIEDQRFTNAFAPYLTDKK